MGLDGINKHNKASADHILDAGNVISGLDE